MIEITNVEVMGWESAIRGMRNPLNSWDKSDSSFIDVFEDSEDLRNYYFKDADIGANDLDLMKRLAKAGSDHAKYRRMIIVTADVLAPLYWWKEYDTYKVGTVANSCSTMHKIQAKEFTLDDFSHEHMDEESLDILDTIIDSMNRAREVYNNGYKSKYYEIKPKNKEYWWQMIQLLPSSYNQLRTVQLNYEVLANIYHSRKNHKLDEWRKFCTFIEQLPYSELITGQE